MGLPSRYKMALRIMVVAAILVTAPAGLWLLAMREAAKSYQLYYIEADGGVAANDIEAYLGTARIMKWPLSREKGKHLQSRMGKAGDWEWYDEETGAILTFRQGETPWYGYGVTSETTFYSSDLTGLAKMYFREEKFPLTFWEVVFALKNSGYGATGLNVVVDDVGLMVDTVTSTFHLTKDTRKLVPEHVVQMILDGQESTDAGGTDN